MIFSKMTTRVSEPTYSPVRGVIEKAVQMRSRGGRVIHFESGQPDFDTPGYIKEAANHL